MIRARLLTWLSNPIRAWRVAGWVGRACAWLCGSCVLLFALFLLLPVVRFDKPISTVLLAADGSLLSASTAADQQWRFPPRSSTPARYATALQRFEDRRFMKHPGFDPLAAARALKQNIQAGKVVSGASTLTMQVVRMWREGKPRTLLEKVIEVVLALRLEWSASKEEILALHASHAPFGGNVVGLDAAAWRYFGRSADQLSWAEAATLAVLPNSPALVHPGRSRDTLLARRNRLLDSLMQAGTLTPDTCELAKDEPLASAPLPMPHLAPHLLARMRGNAPRVVHTTVEGALQERVNSILKRHHARLDGNQIHNVAALVVEVDSGQVKAYVGNAPGLDAHHMAEHQGHVDIVNAPRSTGSVLKPFLFAAAIHEGEILPTELLEDLPLRIGGFAPENFARTYSGAVPAASALARSLNVPAARLLQDHGVDRFHHLLTRLGMTTLDRPASHYGLALILGGAEGTLWDLVGMYSSMARLVQRASHAGNTDDAIFPPHVEQGAKVENAENVPLDPGAVFVTLQAMLEVERPGVEASWREFTAPRKVAWKTGTSFGFRDAWAIGVTPRYAVGVWAGNADGEGRPGLMGTPVAAPILFDIFAALPSGAWFTPPSSHLVPIQICSHSGQRAGPDCADTETIMVPRAGRNARVCQHCQSVNMDATGRYRVHGRCESVFNMKQEKRFVLPAGMETFYRSRHADYTPLPPFWKDCTRSGGDAGSLSILYPRTDSEVYVPLEADGSRGRAVFEAAHREPHAVLFWHLDQVYLGKTQRFHQMGVAPQPGPHTLIVMDAQGQRVERRFTVMAQPGGG